MAQPIPYQFRDFYAYDKDAVSGTAPTSVGVNVRGIQWNTFIADGTIGSDGGALGGVTARGVVYSSSNVTPTIGG